MVVVFNVDIFQSCDPVSEINDLVLMSVSLHSYRKFREGTSKFVVDLAALSLILALFAGFVHSGPIRP